ncbi:succinyl-CoA synthetase subunit beta [Methanogenium marinum]|uniref:Succinyl-CoA synthetase subunit beta n=1 Tax=Methanogenium marinum TaxID=348610 RepID=A0A9Q4KSI9_9EURY|nr:ATP-grasp domain-containing protein [Methanogenium marinum]MDE4907784.1 succinyl-CoA synthetase subunit beta [Methanogenium marinum]
MKLLEFEAKEIFRNNGIPIPEGVVIKSPDELRRHLNGFTDEVVVKSQVDVGGRGKAGGIIVTQKADAVEAARHLFSFPIKGLIPKAILVEEKLPIDHEYYVSISIDRTTRQPMILFAETGGVDIEETARTGGPEALRRVGFSPLLSEVPGFLMRQILGTAPKELGPVINNLYKAFCASDALLAEINPLVTTSRGVFAADAKLIIDDNALIRQGITANRDLTPREREAEENGFSYVELEGSIGVIGNGAGLTMSTLDLIQHYDGKAANFLDVGGGAGRERVMKAVRLVAGMPDVKVIVVNLLGGITRCDEVAKGIIDAGIDQHVITRLAGTNEEEGKALLAKNGYQMLDTMEDVVKQAVKEAAA